MLIDVTNAVCVVSGYDENSRIVLEKTLRVTGDKPDYLTGEFPVADYYTYDGEGRLIFGTGLMPYVDSVLRHNGLEPAYRDNRNPARNLGIYPDARLQFDPYLDQFENAKKAADAGRGVLNLATNYGKTYMICLLWWYLTRPSTLVIVPTQDLLHQTAEGIAELIGVSPDMVGKVGDTNQDWKPITVGVINSVYDWLCTHGSMPLDFDMVIVDEGHKGVSEMYQKLAMSTDACYRYWMSGTPYKKRDPFHTFVISALAGPEICRVSNMDLVKLGRSVYPHIFWVKNKLDGDPTELWEYTSQYKSLKEDTGRNKLIARLMDMAVERGLTVIVFVEHKDHMKNILEHVTVDTETVQGSQSAKNRLVKEGLKSGSIKSVIATSAWRQGVSIAGLDVLIQATGRKAEHDRDQELGRVLRWSPRGCCLVIDFEDKGLKYPAQHSRTRLAHMETHGFPIHRVAVSKIESMFDVFDLESTD